MSLFPDVDAEIVQIKAKEKLAIQELINSSEMYRPSNSTDGDWFYRNFCDKCSKDNIEKEIFCETWNLLLGANSEDIRQKGEFVFCLKDSNFDIKDYMKG